MSKELTMVQTMNLFRELNDYLRTLGIRRVEYKCIPSIYHRLSAEEDMYAIFHECRARIVVRDYATNICMNAGLRWERVRRRGVTRAKNSGITIERSDDYRAFWQVLTPADLTSSAMASAIQKKEPRAMNFQIRMSTQERFSSFLQTMMTSNHSKISRAKRQQIPPVLHMLNSLRNTVLR